jgi:hypothetical protein
MSDRNINAPQVRPVVGPFLLTRLPSWATSSSFRRDHHHHPNCKFFLTAFVLGVCSRPQELARLGFDLNTQDERG